MIYTELTKKAMKICFEAHKNQLDKSGMPYVFHPFHLAEQLEGEYEVCAALLHDVMEDTGASPDDLRKKGIPEAVIEALLLLTHDKSVPYLEYVAKIGENPVARAVKLADLRHNSDLSRLDTVTEKDRKRVLKYKQAVEILGGEAEDDLVSRAASFAAKAHAGMKRKGNGLPYILHPFEAASIVGTMTDDCEVIAAAMLHDVVEDTPFTLSDIEARFGSRVAALVGAESENKREGIPPEQTWRVRKEEAIESLRSCSDAAAKMILLGDKLSNMRSFARDYKAQGDALWQHFNQKDPEMHGWYYRTIAELMPELRDTDAWQEYDVLVRRVFGK